MRARTPLSFPFSPLQSNDFCFHRQWVIREFSLWDDELAFCEKLLSMDVRNNSAWNQRYFVVTNTTGFTDEVIAREIAYTEKQIAMAPNNESAWNYLRGLVRARRFSEFPQIKALCVALEERHIVSPHAQSLMLDMHEEDMRAGNAEAKALALAVSFMQREGKRREEERNKAIEKGGREERREREKRTDRGE